MGCGCKGTSYVAPQAKGEVVQPQGRVVTRIDESYYSKPKYNGPQPKQPQTETPSS